MALKNIVKSILLLIILISTNMFSQIDPNDYYPLHIGDKWEYLDLWNNERSFVEVIGDTLMSNGLEYYCVLGYNLSFQRVVENKVVKEYNEYAENDEYIKYDLISPKKTIFMPGTSNSSGVGVFDVQIDNNNIIGKKLEWREFREVRIDSLVVPPDTTWIDLIDVYWPRITQGIGLNTDAYGRSILIGVRINNVGYGTLTDVKDEQMTLPESFELYQNYPNPFNPSTTIKYNLTNESFIKLKVYDTIGNEVKTLYEGSQTAGQHSAMFVGNDLASGLYFIRLTNGNQNKTIKAMLMK